MIDLAQFEAACAVLGPALLDVAANRRHVEPAGNTSQEAPAAPHGIYRCRGDDRWCAITVFTEDEWRRFVAAVRASGPATAGGDWTAEPRFASLGDRLRNRDALDRFVEAWTAERTPEEVAEQLQAAGVRAGVVANADDLCVRDPQLHARHYWVRVRTPEGDEVTLDGVPYRLPRTPASVSGPGPLLGEHTADVLHRVLGLDDGEIAALRAAGVIA
jgi:benzylsuccinate CoA-transferase BbsF subunit